VVQRRAAVYDISDAYLPREIAWYLPDDPLERRGTAAQDLVTQSEDVLVDARGNIYFSDKKPRPAHRPA